MSDVITLAIYWGLIYASAFAISYKFRFDDLKEENRELKRELKRTRR